MTKIQFIASPAQCVKGEIRVPGDKSISHRSIMFGALAEGTTRVKGFLQGEDCRATMRAFQQMGVEITETPEREIVIQGVGVNGLKAPAAPLDMGNSGTSIRLISGILAGQAFEATLTGDHSLSKRPMGRVTNPLTEMGARFTTNEGKPPMTSHGVEGKLKAMDYVLPMASAQVKSAVLLAGLYADGVTSVTEPAPTRDHTERMLEAFGVVVDVDGPTRRIEGGQSLTACDIDVPSDISSATFFTVAALIAKDADLTIRHVGMNPTRLGMLNILKDMGGDIEILNHHTIGGEPVADIRVKSSQLKGIDINPDDVPLAIDEFPAIFIAAAAAEGKTRLRDAEELRVKESDRIQAMADGLTALGVENLVVADGIDIVGGPVSGGVVESHSDHRIAMSFAIASLIASAPIHINDCANVATSFPNFLELADQVGMLISKEEIDA